MSIWRSSYKFMGRMAHPAFRVFSLVICFLLSCLSPALLLAQTELQYQSRGQWYEGVKPKPVSGYDIELISVLVDYQEESQTLPQKLKLRFYLEQDEDVFLTVRELDYEYYYWLDRVKRDVTHHGKPGTYNSFEWETETSSAATE